MAVFTRLCGGRDLPAEQVAELVIIAGRGAGKTQGAALIVILLACCREWRVSPGQVPVALLMAADKEQAGIAFRFVVGLLESSPILAAEIAGITRQCIELRSGVMIEIVTSDYRAVRGRSIIVAVADELAFWAITADSASPDSEVLTAVRPGLARFHGSLLVCISSPYAQQGELYEYHRRYFGQNDARILVAHGETRAFNPTFPQAIIDDALQRDPIAASAEYLAQFRSDVAAYIDHLLVDSLTRSEPRELAYRAITATGGHSSYVAGLDVSGGRSDATACAIAHNAQGAVIVDAVRRWPSPHDPGVVAAEVAAFLASYQLTSARADQYGASVVRSMYSTAGVGLIDAEHTRSETYLRLLPLMTTGKVELPPDPVLRVELLGLERRVRSGRESVDHRHGSHDDVANAVALAAVAAARAGSGAPDAVVYETSRVWDEHSGNVDVHAWLDDFDTLHPFEREIGR